MFYLCNEKPFSNNHSQRKPENEKIRAQEQKRKFKQSKNEIEEIKKPRKYEK